jgi:periplasmic copper chaperone A
VRAIDIPARASVALGADGYHAMLVDLVRPLGVGDRVPLTLVFERSGTLDVVANVESSPGMTMHQGPAHAQ